MSEIEILAAMARKIRSEFREAAEAKAELPVMREIADRHTEVMKKYRRLVYESQNVDTV